MMAHGEGLFTLFRELSFSESRLPLHGVLGSSQDPIQAKFVKVKTFQNLAHFGDVPALP